MKRTPSPLIDALLKRSALSAYFLFSYPHDRAFIHFAERSVRDYVNWHGSVEGAFPTSGIYFDYIDVLIERGLDTWNFRKTLDILHIIEAAMKCPGDMTLCNDMQCRRLSIRCFTAECADRLEEADAFFHSRAPDQIDKYNPYFSSVRRRIA